VLAAVAILAPVFAVLLPGCSTDKLNVTEFPLKPVVLVDATGQRWDISSAVYEYGMDVTHFEFGLGKNAIPPLISPRMVGPKDRGFPASGGTFLIIGTAIHGDVRAYGMLDIRQSEVVDEVIGGADVAVSY